MVLDGGGAKPVPSTGFGPNQWLVEEMLSLYSNDPESVSEDWRELFSATGATSSVETGSRVPSRSAAPAPGGGWPGDELVTLRGALARTVANMEASLDVPTATSVRTIPAKMLEVNRQLLNDRLARRHLGKISFTHLIGFAVVRAVSSFPNLNATFSADIDGKGSPGVIRHRSVGLGLAVDVARADGTRALVVPCVRRANELDFAQFVVAYDQLIGKVRNSRLSADDLIGTTITLTNPGTFGTEHSVPRLMNGQSLIVGVGAITYPAGLAMADPAALAELGVSKTVTLTSTYDHRVIQGAESGQFLGRVERLLLGEEGFYDEIMASLDVPYQPVRWQPDRNPIDKEHARLTKQVGVQLLINAYRVRGHLMANLDPLGLEKKDVHPELDPSHYGLTLWDLDRQFVCQGLGDRESATLAEILATLRDAYCSSIGVEYMHIQDPLQKRWLQQRLEVPAASLAREDQDHYLALLSHAEAFEAFLHSRYLGQKRFGLEGAEAAMVMMHCLASWAADSGASEMLLAMTHRGRLNFLANLVGKSYREIFREFEDELDPENQHGSGDVKYHKGGSGKFTARSGREIRLTLAANPSHLEAVGPVVLGMTRATQDHSPSGPGTALAVLLHGDAAFSGQGVVAETLELSQLSGYRVGGSIHLVVNNQLGFTTTPHSGRSSLYPTDVAKIIQSPVFHVNGDDVEACARVALLAADFRSEFKKDVVIDMVCYRRFGHNETDEPSYTQPRMYEAIQAKKSVRQIYLSSLVRRGVMTEDEADSVESEFVARLGRDLAAARGSRSRPPQYRPIEVAMPSGPADVVTAVNLETLTALAQKVRWSPPDFRVHPKLMPQFAAQMEEFHSGLVGWPLAEALAFATLLAEGTDLRLAGQDSQRGTFSHRHAVLVDHVTEEKWIPLAHLGIPGAGTFSIHNSPLSEYAALGFEYGYSVARPDALVMWEAQFGDFANGAQVVIDQFIAAADDKWGQSSSLTLLLPHGYEGQGPEHSSARLERYLSLCANGNLRVVQPTTASQIFHLLRGQARVADRRPMVVMAPKSLLRLPAARCPLDEFTSGNFRPVLGDPGIEPGSENNIFRVVLCTGRVAYDALAFRDRLSEAGSPSRVAVVRVEQLYPWPQDLIYQVLDRYPSATQVVWLQDEPVNMGAWPWVRPRLEEAVGRGGRRLLVIGRPESASPASGSAALHRLESLDLLTRTFAPL